MQDAFQTTEPTLKSILDKAASGTLQLPEFQRSWVWDDARIRSLVASVSRAFPIGAVMTLRSGGEVKLKARPIEGAHARNEPEALLLDGQQRITSLFRTTTGGQVVVTNNGKNQKVRRWYYIDMRRALADPSEREEAIVGVPEDRVVRADIGRRIVLDLSSREREFEELMFPLQAVFDANAWARSFRKFWRDRGDDKKEEFYDAFDERVIETFKNYKLPVIQLAAKTPREAVCAVFEKVNTGGKALDAFELVTAAFAAEGFGDLRKDWQTRQEAMADGVGVPNGVLSKVSSTDFLQVVALLDGLDRRSKGTGQETMSAARASLLRMEAATYTTYADAAQTSFVAAGKFLRQLGIFFSRDLPYQTQLVPLAAIIHALGKDWEREATRAKIAHWYWCGVFGELYGAAVESRFVNDVTQVPTWVAGDEEPRTIAEALFRPERLWTMRTRSSAAYKGVNALLLLAGAKDWRDGSLRRDQVLFEESVDIHHIFPKRWCIANGIVWQRYDSVINKTPLSASANRRIGGRAPSEYLRKIDTENWAAGNIDDLVSSHLIEPSTLRADDFERFTALRSQALLHAIESAMGKRAHTEEAAEPTEEDAEEQKPNEREAA